MALALHPDTPTLTYGTSPYRRRSHLRLVVTEAVIDRRAQQVQASDLASVYIRRRVVAIMVGLGLLGAGIFGLHRTFGDSTQANEHLPGRISMPNVVIAQPGDTLWAIARRIIPVGSITELVDQLVVMNGAEITAGQEVRLP